MKKLIALLTLALAAAMAAAAPTLQEVQAEVQQGRLAQAESMMAEVVAATPGSATAHYVYAEVLARNGNVVRAREEARRAREIDPQITFTDPAKFQAFEQLLARGPGSTTPAAAIRDAVPATPVEPVSPAAVRAQTPAASSFGIPGWVWGAAIALAAAVIWRALQRRRSAATAAGAAAPAGVAASAGAGRHEGVGGGVSPHGADVAAGQPPSSTMLGTGMAVAGGVAGGMLLDQALRGRQDGDPAGGGIAALGAGLEPGIVDAQGTDPSMQELQGRGIDFGRGDGSSGGGDIADSGDGGDGGD